MSDQVDAYPVRAQPSCPAAAWLFPVWLHRAHLHLLKEMLLNWSDVTYQILHLLNYHKFLLEVCPMVLG